MTTDGARALLIGNPTRTAGEFYDAFHSKRADYNTPPRQRARVAGDHRRAGPRRSLRAALTGREWVESRRRAWGEDSPLFQVRVLGNFPRRATDTVVDLGDVEDAQARELDVPVPAQLEDVVVVCDVAGSAATRRSSAPGTARAFASPHLRRQGDDRDRRLDHRRVARAARRVRRRPRIVVDDDGVGGGVTDQLREKGYEVTAFNGGERALEPTRYPNARSEAWFRMARRLPELDLDEDDQLAADLTAPKYRLDSDGRRVVERKDETKKRLGRSPDRGDMALLTLVPTLTVTLPDEDDRRPAIVRSSMATSRRRRRAARR
jgi:phage terminase large subunit